MHFPYISRRGVFFLSDLLFSINAVAPMVIIIAIGYFFARVGLMKEPFISQGNRLCYQVFLPLQLFRSIYTSQSSLTGSLNSVIFCLGGSLLVYSAMLVLALKIEKVPERQASLATIFMKSNFVLFGLSLAAQLLGDGNTADVALTIAMLVPLNNIFVITVFTLLLKDKNASSANRFGTLLKKIITNPIFLGAVIGLVFSRLQITLPIFADKVVSQLSNISVPLALLLLGAGFKFSNISVYKKEILLVTGLKGFLLPAGALALASMLGFNTVQMVCVLVIFGSPAASSTYVMAREFGADDTLSANGVIFSSLVSVVTIFFCVLFLRVAGYL